MKAAYDQAAASGRYEGRGGLLGKYDNVRLEWEEAGLLRHLAPLLRRRGDGGLRVCDLGCGGGDGLALLRAAVGTAEQRPIAAYTGVDLVDSLLVQARDRFADDPAARFVRGDLAAGLPAGIDAAPYDVYVASFGTLSHLDTEATVRLLADVARHGRDGGLVIADWLGRFSFEWRDLWDDAVDDEQWMDYRISYIYQPEERRRREIPGFPLRLVAPEEVAAMVDAAERAGGRRLAVATVEDRSLLCGRHIDTGEYNGTPQPIRAHLNRLLEPGARTGFAGLHASCPPRPGYGRHNRFFADLARRWNALVEYAAWLRDGRGDRPPPADAGVPATTRAHLADAGDDDEFERRLALALRDLEISRQEGSGHGHGLVAVLRIGERAAG